MSLVDRGDEVILTDPTYLGYREMIEFAQGKTKWLRVNVDEGYQPSVEGLKAIASKKTKAIIVLSPDNPTGRILHEGFVKALIDLAQDHKFWIISDDIYKHIVYEGEHVWISRFSGGMERTIVVCSFSKEAGIPGLRLGYALAPSDIIESMEKIQQYSTLAPNSLAQFAMVKFLNENIKEPYLRDNVMPSYLRKRDLMGELLKSRLPFANTVRPQGAFYYFVDLRESLSKLNLNEDDFASRLLREQGVAVVPGRFFGDSGKGHVRLTFVSESENRIDDGIQKMGDFLTHLS
jgi:aspartate aminotransferase